MPDRSSPDQLVVIGASAGGIEALSTLVATLSPGFPAPIVIAQHLDPRRPSRLGHILAQRSALPVHTVADHAPLERGAVYVVPANRDVAIADGELSLRGDGGRHPKPSINLLFRSAAQAYGERLIAVVLTGTGADGAAGARDVKQAGGTVIIQNPATASFPGMPESLAPSTVDIVADLERIGPLLKDLLSGADHAIDDDRRLLPALLDQLRDGGGIDFSSYKSSTILRRLQRRMAATGIATLSDYLHYIHLHPEERQRLISSFLIKVTEFFRDPELFAYLREQVLPDLLAEARRRGGGLRAWSAGCATGEEAYSLAILIADALGDELDQLNFNVRIFATDLDAKAIAFARRGVYPAPALAGLPPELIERHFDVVDGEYWVKKRVRALTIFAQHDLGQRPPFPRIDLVLCRNVLIYFTPELQKRALQLFAFSLRNGGYLVLGQAETADPLGEYFVRDHQRLSTYRRQGDHMLIPSTRLKEAMPEPPMRAMLGRRAPAPGRSTLARAPRETPRARTSNERLGSLLLSLPIGVVVVDRRYDIQAINAAARRLLGIHSAAIGEDVVHLARHVPLDTLRGAIDAAFENAPATPSIGDDGTVTVEVQTSDGAYLRLACYAQAVDANQGPATVVVVVVTDIDRLVRQRDALAQDRAHQQAEMERQAAQTRQLADDNRRLLETDQELTAINLELRSSIEEFLVSNEEMQAATEEVETLNEELQSANEELETLNEELQATVEELNTTNDDLQARSIELQAMAVSLEAQRQASEEGRVRLSAVLASIGDAVVVVDRGGTPVITNAAYDSLFGDDGGILSDEAGRPLRAEDTLQQRARRGETFSMAFTMAPRPGSGPEERRWLEATGAPLAPEHGGGVVVIRDITERSLRHLQDEFLALASHELRTPLTPIQGYLEMLTRLLRSDADERAGRYAALAHAQVQRLKVLVSDLLDVGRLQSGKLNLTAEVVELSSLMAQVVEMAQMDAPGQTIHLDTPPDEIRVQGDPARLEQIVLNLLTNANKHAPESKRIDVCLRHGDGEAEIQVQDYGPGIAPSDLPNLFSRFYQVEHGTPSANSGLGLGLYITRELVTAHGGRIDVSSTPGEGTTFTVRLPLLPDAGA